MPSSLPSSWTLVGVHALHPSFAHIPPSADLGARLSKRWNEDEKRTPSVRRWIPWITSIRIFESYGDTRCLSLRRGDSEEPRYPKMNEYITWIVLVVLLKMSQNSGCFSCWNVSQTMKCGGLPSKSNVMTGYRRRELMIELTQLES